MAKFKPAPPVAVILGDDEFQKSAALRGLLDSLLPPEVDRAMALSEFDGSRSEEQGGPTLAAVLDDLATLPFLADRRVVLIRDADKFISAHRDRLEKYLHAPAPTGTLVLVCRSMPSNTRIYKAAVAARGEIISCAKLRGRGLVDFVISETRARGKRIDYPVAARLAELVGPEAGMLAGEVEKLCLYGGERPAITIDDITALVGLSREEKIFTAMDAAGAGNLRRALDLWNQVITTDPDAVYKAVGGMAYIARRWATAHRLAASRMPLPAIAPKVMMWGREDELKAILRRQPPGRIKRTLAAIADLDSQAKVGARSIESGVEALFIELATQPA